MSRSDGHQPDEGIIPDDYSDTYLACRDLRHAWEPHGYYRGAEGGIHRWLVCLRCRMERTDDWLGSQVRHRYNRPDGYRLPGRVHAVEVRNAVLDRVPIHRSEEEMRAASRRPRRRNLRLA